MYGNVAQGIPDDLRTYLHSCNRAVFSESNVLEWITEYIQRQCARHKSPPLAHRNSHGILSQCRLLYPAVKLSVGSCLYLPYLSALHLICASVWVVWVLFSVCFGTCDKGRRWSYSHKELRYRKPTDLVPRYRKKLKRALEALDCSGR